ncbi:uncharacterized protein LOC124921658 [Impatiens glandulifera]|uniref:uncharacterized protein LOC124921658 n=1 Tax=Impatiens glandulifera TaxID=253017 RepID=UPI001FB0A964|nr:uncharacterized protein LOC124921658 [Impatiens glandulifera]
METPSSVRMSTRSHTKAAASALSGTKKFEESKQKKTGLFDITNDSPIVGLAAGSLKTPSSDMSRKRNVNRCWEIRTPGSGEALLRGQVKTLLQKVEEEAEITKISLNFHGFVMNSTSSGIVAPANTPQVPRLLDQDSFKDACFGSVTISPVKENSKISKWVSEIFDEGKKQDGSDIVSRSLLSEFSDKAEGYSSSETGIKTPSSTSEDDNSSVWSLQVNASIRDDEEEEEEDDYYEEELLDELCKGISKMKVGGMHTRFVYDSEDELVKEEKEAVAEGVLKLKGLPTPQGKHLRFPQEEDEEEKGN